MHIHYILVLLGWFVGKEEVNLTVMEPGYLIDEEGIEVVPKNVVDGVMDENVDISLISKYFTLDAWMLIEDVITQKRRKLHFTCSCCSQALSESCQWVIVCNHCLCWFHLNCVGLKKLPKAKHWFCVKCS